MEDKEKKTSQRKSDDVELRRDKATKWLKRGDWGGAVGVRRGEVARRNLRQERIVTRSNATRVR